MTENPPAFPHLRSNSYDDDKGMDLRDWFAGQVDISAYDPVATFERKYRALPNAGALAEYIAALRYLEADAMLAERERSK